MAGNPNGIRSHPEDRGDLARLDVEPAEDGNNIARISAMLQLAESEGDEDIQPSPQFTYLFSPHACSISRHSPPPYSNLVSRLNVLNQKVEAPAGEPAPCRSDEVAQAEQREILADARSASRRGGNYTIVFAMGQTLPVLPA